MRLALVEVKSETVELRLLTKPVALSSNPCNKPLAEVKLATWAVKVALALNKLLKLAATDATTGLRVPSWQ